MSEPIARAKSITHIETDRSDATVSGGSLTATAAQNQLQSFRLFPASLPRAVKILPSDTRITEAGDAGSFTVVRTGDMSAPLDVPYTVSGAATAGSDYEALSGTATIPAGASSVVITLRPLADTFAEATETITVTLSTQPSYLLGLWRSATALIVASTGQTPPPPPPSGGTRALYPFSEGTGGTTADASGNGNQGTLSAATWVTGKYGQGLQFNGSTSFVSVPDSASLDIGSTGTVEAWVNLNAVNRWHGIVAKGSANSSSAHNYALEVDSGNHVECGIGNGASSNAIRSSATLASGTLYHVACVWTGTQHQVYVNGVLSATAPSRSRHRGTPRRCTSASTAATPTARTASSTRCGSPPGSDAGPDPERHERADLRPPVYGHHEAGRRSDRAGCKCHRLRNRVGQRRRVRQRRRGRRPVQARRLEPRRGGHERAVRRLVGYAHLREWFTRLLCGSA